MIAKRICGEFAAGASASLGRFACTSCTVYVGVVHHWQTYKSTSSRMSLFRSGGQTRAPAEYGVDPA